MIFMETSMAMDNFVLFWSSFMFHRTDFWLVGLMLSWAIRDVGMEESNHRVE